MTILRSREIPSVSGKPPSNRRSQIIQPSTPVRTQEPTFHHSPNEPTLDGSGPTNTFRRRSPRLSLNGFTEKEVSVSVCSKRKSNVGEKFLNLRSGKRVAKRSVENGVEIDSIHVSLSDDSKERKSGNESKRKRVCVDVVEEDNSDGAVVSGYIVGDTVRKIEALVDGSKNKGKGIVEDSYQVNGDDTVVNEDIVGDTVRKIEALGDESKDKGKGIVEDSYEVNNVEMKCVESCERPSSSVGRRKYTREEKGKSIQLENVENVYPPTRNETTGVGVEEMEIESLINNQKLPEASGAELSAAANAEQTQNLENGNASKNQHFRDIAKKNASRFAYFDAESEGEDESSDKEVEQVEDWPGPFSTAMKIIQDREDNTIVHNGFSFSYEEKTSPIIWVPRRNNSFPPPRAPSLQELSLRILVKNADAITSLNYVPDALRVKLCQLLCDSRRMDVHFLDLLVRGSPTGICVPDCSWMTEEQFTECFKNCDTSNLMVLQLDQCGRCMPDYVLPSTLARSPKNLPVLSSLSLSGACRLTDVGLRALVSAARAIKSINLSQCSLLTSSSIDMLSDSLGSVLSELYLNECQGIDLKLILSALKKFEKLEVLSLVDLPSVRGRFLKEFVTARGQALKQLILTNSVKLTDTSVKDISENCPNLSVLDLANVCKLTDRALGYLANGSQALEKLVFCRNSFSDEAVATFVETAGGSLMELSLNNVKKVGHNTASALAKLSAKLQILDVSWCRDMSDHSLGYIVDNCSSLKVLKVFGCSQITDVFIEGHSNPNVRILGLKMSPFLDHLTKNLADN